MRAVMVIGLVGASAPWLGSVSYSVQLPATLNKTVKVGRFFGQDSPFAPGAAIAQPGRPAFVLAQARPAVIRKKLPFPATDLGVIWSGDGLPPEIRIRSDGGSWSEWRRVEDNVDMFDERTGTHYSALIPGQRATFAELRPPWGTDQMSLNLSVINTVDGPRKTVKLTRSASAATGKPEVIARAAWGADESIRRGEDGFSRAKRIFVHHTATPNNDADPAGTIRAIHSYHVKTRGYHDIGYNFLIDHRGRVFEGRYSGAPPPGETPSGENSNGLSVLGAHTRDHNAGSIGIAMLGDSSSASPSRPALDSLVRLSAWAADRHGIDPLGKSRAADGETLPNIAGHKDSRGSITHCPGVLLQEQLPAVREQVEKVIAASSADSPPSMPTGTTLNVPSPSSSMTPNATGDVSRSAVRVDLIFTGAGVPSRIISAVPKEGSFAVTDASYGGEPLRPGSYSVRAVAFDAQGRRSPEARVADDLALRRPSALPALDAIVAPVLSPPLAGADSGALAGAMTTVIKVLGL